jgi:hypothetical protein
VPDDVGMIPRGASQSGPWVVMLGACLPVVGRGLLMMQFAPLLAGLNTLLGALHGDAGGSSLLLHGAS